MFQVAAMMIHWTLPMLLLVVTSRLNAAQTTASAAEDSQSQEFDHQQVIRARYTASQQSDP